jgi:hypothetical protein
MRIDSNLVAGMVEDMVEYDPDCMVSVPNFCAALTTWWRENRGDKPPGADAVGRALKLLSEKIAVDKKQLRTNSRRFYAGVRLNDDGLRAFAAYCTSGSQELNTDRDVALVNVEIPAQWSRKSVIINMRNAHGDASRKAARRDDAPGRRQHRGPDEHGPVHPGGAGEHRDDPPRQGDRPVLHQPERGDRTGARAAPRVGRRRTKEQ